MPSFWPLLPLSVFILERVRSGTTSSLKLKYVAKPGGNICFTVSISYFILRRLFLNLIAFISDAMRSLQFTTFERRWHGKVCLIYLVGWKRLYLKLCFLYTCYPPPPPTSQQCMLHSWSLDVDMQLFLIAPFFVYAIWRWKKGGIAFLSAFTVGSLVYSAVLFAFDDSIPMTYLPNRWQV